MLKKVKTIAGGYKEEEKDSLCRKFQELLHMVTRQEKEQKKDDKIGNTGTADSNTVTADSNTVTADSNTVTADSNDLPEGTPSNKEFVGKFRESREQMLAANESAKESAKPQIRDGFLDDLKAASRN